MSATDTPTGERLWQGALLGTIAHASFTCSSPELAYEQSWDGWNYSVQNTEGSRGTVSFAPKGVVGAFFDAESPRGALGGESTYSLDPYLRGIPSELRSLAERDTLQYLLQDVEGEAAPVITAAFWTPGRGALSGSEPWARILEHGAHLVRIQLLPIDQALTEWRAYYELNDSQASSVRALYNRKLARPTEAVTLTAEEVAVFTSRGNRGIMASRELLSDIGVVLP